MIKNQAGQSVVAQLIDRTDGSAVTLGPTSVFVTGDGGVQGAGGGAVEHEGNGCWRYEPTQAETNYDHVAFTFVNASSVTVSVQIYTRIVLTGLPGCSDFTYTVVDSLAAPVAGATVWFTTDVGGANVIWTGTTDTFGVARDASDDLPCLDPGTYYVWVHKPGYTPNDYPDVEVVT